MRLNVPAEKWVTMTIGTFMLKVTKDRKVTNAVTPAGNPAIANSFGLPAGRTYSCPDATDYCERICYAGKLEKLFPNARKALMHNWDMLKDANLNRMYYLLDTMIAEFEKQCDKRGAEKFFRIHWDGDFFSPDYTTAWAIVIAGHPNVKFWVYTRVPGAASFLHDMRLPNLSLYFSADPDNIDTANSLKGRGIKIAYVDQNFAKGKVVVKKAVKCPENSKALPLISEKGSACAVCRLCIDNRNNVLFSTSKG